jgi:hypothetical protein
LAATANAEAGPLRLDDPALRVAAFRVEHGGSLRIEGVRLAGDLPLAALELERFQVFMPGARVAVHSATGLDEVDPVERAHFRGLVSGAPKSLVTLALSRSGSLRGWIAAYDRWFAVARRAGGVRPEITEVDLEVGEPSLESACAAGPLDDLTALRTWPRAWNRPSPVSAGTGDVQYAVDLAVDTDWEFFQLFGSVEAATEYATDLVASASAVYERDVGTHLQISLLILWTTPFDPWTVEGDLLEALYEFGDVWHATHAETERTVAHLLSGKTSLGGGIAYGGVLCSPDIFVNGHWAGGYGLSGSMTAFGDFRDIFIFSHELGHNFDSRHTHCYNDVPLPGDPEIDQCRSGETTGSGHVCYGGEEGLPPDGGSIMSYCHLQPGGYGNINLWLGKEGSFGVRSERVPEKMLQHVEAVAACLPDPPGIFSDGFESGDTSAWSQTVP